MTEILAGAAGLDLQMASAQAERFVHVAGDAPVAVLLVDRAARSVVYVNPVAEQLAPGVTLPAPVDEWSDAAVLRDVNGEELSDSEHPLSAITETDIIPGQPISAERATEMGRQREPLWALCLPLTGAPQLEGHALVVLLALSGRDPHELAAQAEADLRERAVLATGMSFTVADATSPELELIWVNPAFTAVTGYTFEESVGRNCRFLQGPATDRSVPQAMRKALEDGIEITATLLNYRKDGTAFWNQVSMSPIHGPDGRLTHYVGIQSDVTARVAADEERDRALRAERAAREEAELAHRQLALLAEAASGLVTTLDVHEALVRLTKLVIPELADWVLLALPGRRGEIAEVLGRHRHGREEELREYVDALLQSSTQGSIFRAMFAGAPARRVVDYGSAERRAERAKWVDGTELLDRSEAFGADSVLFVPLPGRREVVGSMALLRGPDSPPYTARDLAVAEDLGRRAGLLLDNARLYQAEDHIAETLQRSLLPTLPTLPEICAAARYQAGESTAHVGGDFYELLDLPDGSVGFAIGDVVGHDVMAAAAMGHLRGLLRASAYEGAGGREGGFDPADVLDRVDRMVQTLDVTSLATVIFGRLERAGETWALEYSNAGHPPLMVRHKDGSVEVLDGAGDLLLGVESRPRSSRRVLLRPGDAVVAYTDGLVERRGRRLDDGLVRLQEALAAAPGPVEDMCDALLEAMGESDDDVALLVIQPDCP